jgi:ABC-type glycerol-3-phosphate transport system substrate-binding protein
MFELGGYIPVNAQVYEDADFMARHPDLTYYRALLNNGFHRPSLVDYTRISDIISHFVRAAIRRDMTTKEALRQASEMIRSNQVLIK